MSRVVAPPITTRPAALTGGPVQASRVFDGAVCDVYRLLYR